MGGPERAPQAPHASRPGEAVALRERAVRYGLPRLARPPSPRVSRPRDAGARRERAVRYGLPRLANPSKPPALRAPVETWRSANVQSDTASNGPARLPKAPRVPSGAGRRGGPISSGWRTRGASGGVEYAQC